MNSTINNTNISEYDKMVQLHESAMELRGLKSALALEAAEQAFEIANRLRGFDLSMPYNAVDRNYRNGVGQLTREPNIKGNDKNSQIAFSQ